MNGDHMNRDQKMRPIGKWTLCFASAMAFSAVAVARDVASGARGPAPGSALDSSLPACGIQGLIDAAPDGGEVVLPAGTFLLERGLALKRGVTLRGQGENTVLTVPEKPAITTLAEAVESKATALAVADANGFAVGMEIGIRDGRKASCPLMRGIVRRIDGNRIELESPLAAKYAAGSVVANIFPAVSVGTWDDEKTGRTNGVQILSLKILGPPSRPDFPYGDQEWTVAGIMAIHSRDTLVADCVVERWPADGISIQGGRGVRVMGNTVRGCAGSGLHPGSSLADSFFSGNTAEANGSFGLFFCMRNRRVVVSHNTFRENAGPGVGHLGGAGDEDCLVLDNLCESNRLAGIETGTYWSSSDPCWKNFVVGNRCRENGRDGKSPEILLKASKAMVVAQNVLESDGHRAGLEEMADGITDGNYLIANGVTAKTGDKDIADIEALAEVRTDANLPIPDLVKGKSGVVARGKATVVTAEYPGAIPADRLAVLNELLELDRASMEAWRKR